MIQKILLQSFIYTTDWLTLNAGIGLATPFTLSILADADFECNYVTGAVRQAGVLVGNWAGSVQVNDSARGRTIFNNPIAFDSIAGDGRQPYPFNPPRLFRANSSLVITLVTPVATATDVCLSFHGNKRFPNGVLPIEA
jgi:hypothetical protein